MSDDFQCSITCDTSNNKHSFQILGHSKGVRVSRKTNFREESYISNESIFEFH